LTPRTFNRDHSWIDFAARVVAEASHDRHPLLERVRFLALSGHSSDEFFATRVARHLRGGERPAVPAGDPSLADALCLAGRLDSLDKAQHEAWLQLRRALAAEGVVVLSPGELTMRERAWLDDHALRQLAPLVTPLAIGAARPFPFLPAGQPALALDLERWPGRKTVRALIVLPTAAGRFIELPDMFERGARLFVAIEDVFLSCADRLFPGCTVRGGGLLRVLRDGDLPVEESGDDMIRRFEKALRRRRRADPVRLEVSASMPDDLVAFVQSCVAAEGPDASRIQGFFAPRDLAMLADLDCPRLRYPPHRGVTPPRLAARDAALLDVIRDRDLVVHHPYESFDPVVRLLDAAADDPAVVSVKHMLYRTSRDSPIVAALKRAAEAGKAVTAVVELKARSDEEANVRWARDLEHSGAQVVFGFSALKTHAKLTLVARREGAEIVTYTHLGTGNYNPDTARHYTDISYFSADPALGRDANRIFNYATGSCEPRALESLRISPLDLRQTLLDAIRNEAAHALAGRPAMIWAKCNGLADGQIIEALYEASAAGVEIELVVRGICCLRPGVPGLSERIRVRSILGRFLEHSRIYAFGNGHALPHPRAVVYISSADLMPRNLDRRLEVLLQVTEPGAHERILAQILAANVMDNDGSWLLQPDGSWLRDAPAMAASRFSAQEFLMNGTGPARRAQVARTQTGGGPMVVPVPPADARRAG
jgi:polyphosphate kinase